MGYDMYWADGANDADHREYYRFNIAGMQQMRQYMEQAKVLDFKTNSTMSPNPGQVPAFKFCSNDGWHITPKECLAIALGLSNLFKNPDSGISQEDLAWAAPFVLYCLAAANHRGFYVH